MRNRAVSDPALHEDGLSPAQATAKRAFDLLAATAGLLLTGWLIVLSWLAATWDTRANGFFTQERVGRQGRLFRIVKLRTMRPDASATTTVTTTHDARITRLGRLFRRLKIDELPQLLNVLRGEMSIVGPRPDVPGFADALVGGDRIILAVRPGITGPASLRYRNEEELLAQADDAERYNREVIYPDKVRINREYVQNWSLGRDLIYIWNTITSREGSP